MWSAGWISRKSTCCLGSDIPLTKLLGSAGAVRLNRRAVRIAPRAGRMLHPSGSLEVLGPRFASGRIEQKPVLQGFPVAWIGVLGVPCLAVERSSGCAIFGEIAGPCPACGDHVWIIRMLRCGLGKALDRCDFFGSKTTEHPFHVAIENILFQDRLHAIHCFLRIGPGVEMPKIIVESPIE